MHFEPEQINYLSELNRQHEEHMLTSGIDRFLKRQHEGTRKRNKKTGEYQRVYEESNTAYGAMLVKKYAGLLAMYLEEWIQETDARQAKEGRGLPEAILLLKALDVSVVAYVTVSTIVDYISQLPGMVALANHISRRIEDQARFWLFEQQNPEYLDSLVEDWKRRNISNYHHKRAALIHCEQKNEVQWTSWSAETCTRFGCILIDSLINCTSDWQEGKRVIGSGLIERRLEDLMDDDPTAGKFNKKHYQVHVTEKTVEMIKDCIAQNAAMYPQHLPILRPPRNWTNAVDGGYWLDDMRKTTPIIKAKTALERDFLNRVIPDYSGMPDVYDSLNALQAVPYRINRRVYEQLVSESRKNDGVKMPRLEPYIIPDCPIGQLRREDFETYGEWKTARQDVMDALTPKEKASFGDWLEESRDIYTAEAKRKGEWVGLWLTMAAAQEMKQHDQFWFVWNMDTRSRAYTLSTALSFQGNKYGKALLEYAEESPIGDGIDSILVYIAGLWGVDKDSIEDRRNWAVENADMIMQVYSDPEATRDWWKQADKGDAAWEFLAACLHFGPAIKGHSKGMDVSKFTTHGRVHFDGKCNSTQHFSMMTRDPIGAKQVNLLPIGDADKPEDIYGVAAQALYQKIIQLTTSTKYPDKEYAKNLLRFGIDRALLKKPTMTYTYGGTVRGCLRYLKEYLPSHAHADFLAEWKGPDDKKYGGPRRYAKWLHTIMYQAVQETMWSVKQAMEYLQKLGWVVAKHSGKAMVFYTPAGFPVLHWEDDVRVIRVKIRLRGEVLVPRINQPTGQCNPWKMKNQLPPNFVHSLDATHMHRVVAKASKQGVYVTPIHDSYGCRPCDAGYLQQLIRDEFVELYQEDRLQNLMDEQIMFCPEIADRIPEVSEHVQYGDFDIEQVRQAKYSFL